jgi:hypothetical protein
LYPQTPVQHAVEPANRLGLHGGEASDRRGCAVLPCFEHARVGSRVGGNPHGILR